MDKHINPPVDLSVLHDFVSKPELSIEQMYCKRCDKIIEAGFDSITPCWTLPLEPATEVRDAMEAVLLFHSTSSWSNAKVRRWEELVGEHEATTKVLCDFVRKALTKYSKENI